jgi:hypothetical protein
MSTNITLVVAALATLTLTLGLGAAQANTKGPSSPPQHPPHGGGAATQGSNWQPHWRPYGYNNHKTHQNCYWLPTVSNGNLSGLEQKCIWVNS